MKITQKEKKILKGMPIGSQNEIVANRFTGEKVELCPEAVALYDIIIGSEHSLNTGQFDESIGYDISNIFYTAIDVFKRNWPKEYMILLD